MSKWRLKGFVQDSDDEEEDLEITPPHSNRESQHDQSVSQARTKLNDLHDDRDEIHQSEWADQVTNNGSEILGLSSADKPKGASSSRPTTSPRSACLPRPSTPSVDLVGNIRDATESSDPIQTLPSRPVGRIENHRSFSFSHDAPVPNQAASAMLRQGCEKGSSSNGFLESLGVIPLSDASDSDTLSDPPSDMDMDAPIVQTTMFTSPKHGTAVQVVIPRSTAARREYRAREVARSLRQRKPIQLHPYALEGEMYRRELQGRGIKPVARPRSPTRNFTHDDTETQGQEFNPHREALSSSPPEIPVSTPSIQKSVNTGHRRIERPLFNAKLPGNLASGLNVPNGVKRRNFDRSPPQATTPRHRTASDSHTSQNDLWTIPQSPPDSRSPLRHGTSSDPRRLTRPLSASHVLDLPTPSQLSSLQGDSQPAVISGSEPDIRSVRRSTKHIRQTVVIPSDSSSTSSQAPCEESEPSESELEQARKKMKGVLPASWLRIDQAQAKRKARARLRLNAASPDRTEPQRGVAQRIMNRRRPRQSVAKNHQSNGIITISDESNDESDSHIRATSPDQQSAQMAADMAAALDQRYADDDSDSMENDRLQLFTLGGPSRKRKRPNKQFDIHTPAKKSETFDKSTRVGGTLRAFVPKGQKHSRSQRPKHTQPPALSVLDFELSPSGGQQHIPQFLRVARRQARQRPDFARELPRNKHIRLQTATDTEDAHTTLRQWTSGVLKPRTINGQSATRPDGHSPLVETVANSQRTRYQPVADKAPSVLLQENTAREVQSSRRIRQQKLSLGSGPRLVSSNFSRARVSRPPSKSNKQRKVVQRKRHPFRAAQIEGSAADYGRVDRSTVFQQGLQEVDRLFDIHPSFAHPSRNPQLARFLADPDTSRPRASSKTESSDKEIVPSPPNPSAPRRRIKRKVQAQRLDVNTRHYRQPSEPPLVDILDHSMLVNSTCPAQEKSQVQPALQGLGPYGTRYSITFDVSPMTSDTYFHASTFIGGLELHQALQSRTEAARDLDQASGYLMISHDEITIRCGAWNDETFSLITNLMKNIWHPLSDATLHDDERTVVLADVLQKSSRVLRSMITYFSTRLSFVDPIDRQPFVVKLKHFGESLLNQTLTANLMISKQVTAPSVQLESLRLMTYLLVIVVQGHGFAQHSVVSSSTAAELAGLIVRISRSTVSHIMCQVLKLGEFLDRMKQFTEREKGIQNSDIPVESVVVCMHVLAVSNITGVSFWDCVNHELASKVDQATSLTALESLWATLFTLLPFVEVDTSGIVDNRRRRSNRKDDWILIGNILKRLFTLYPYTGRLHSSSVNDYVRANLKRCHHLIHFWHWDRCDRMLNVTYDFFAKNGLKNLQREESNGSFKFLEDVGNKQALQTTPSDSAFHIFLKCLALGLFNMTNACPEKELRSFALRLTPLHGRSNPKDQPMETEARDALRNQYDLLCTRYYASPPFCRPKLDPIRESVNHETSHREACRLNVRAWANLAAFQLSTNEPYMSAQPLALWHKEIIQQTLKQYHLAKTEADVYLNSAEQDRTSASSLLVRKAMEKNQEQVIATLRDCIAGMRKAMKTAAEPASARDFLIDSGIVDLLKLPHFEDARLVAVIRDILGLLRVWTSLSNQQLPLEVGHPSAEESQDLYGGESIDAELLYALEQQQPAVEMPDPPLDFIRAPLWNLMSNAFGAEKAPDDDLLMDCVDAWALFASHQVSARTRSWSYYINPHGSVSWQQLSQTEQTQKFTPYFMAAFIKNDPSAYTEHRLDFIHALLLSLTDREAMLRFQHRLLQALSHVAPEDPLLSNLPFAVDPETGEPDITADTLRTRRLSLVSSLLANMRENFNRRIYEDADCAAEVKENYSVILRGFMSAMKTNYQQLRQSSVATGAYVEFVQMVIQLLQQYTVDICPVLDFFTNSAAFPLPSTDPTYVVGRLCGYAPKLSRSGVPKQLSVFIQTVAQQAAASNQQSYLSSQLNTALCTDHAPAKDRTALRDVLLQGIFPSYIEAAFESVTGFVVAKPILQSLRPIFQATLFDTHVFDGSNVCAVLEMIMAISHAFIRSTEQIRTDAHLVQQPYVLHATTLMLDAMAPVLSLLDYVHGRCSYSTKKPPLVTYLERYNEFITEVICGLVPHDVPVYEGEDNATQCAHYGLWAFCADGLAMNIRANWAANGERVYFGQGRAKREVVVDLESVEGERAALANAMRGFGAAVTSVYGEQHPTGDVGPGRSFVGDVDV